MRDVWFHKRRPDEGVGYSVANRKGVLVSAGFIAVSALVSVSPHLLGYTSALAAVVGVALTIPVILLFVAIVKWHGDDQA